jgi:DNA polymerase II large subunit
MADNNINTTVETNTQETGAATATEQTTGKTYTEQELQDFLQRETDRRVTAALKKQQASFETKMAEAEKLRNMDEAQRKDYEYNQKVAELEQREKDFNLAQNKLEASKVLANRGLPIEFVEYVVADDADAMLENINTFDKAFKSAVADAVSRQLASPTPKSGSVKQTGLTKEDFKKMNLAQQAELYKTNPTLYKELTNR